jgi:hypothetical protein
MNPMANASERRYFRFQAQPWTTLCWVWALWLPVIGLARDKLLWRDPGRIETIDFKHPAGGAGNIPRPPFYFVEEDFGGTSPKVLVRDGAGVLWRVKSGYEIRAESFATRMVAALGYYAEPTVFMPGGKIVGVGRLKRADNFVHQDGSFGNAAFERRDSGLKYLGDRDWAWNDNPFIETRELKGLKLLVMLLSNWDNKDVRDRKLGSNTGILERRVDDAVQWIYFVNDWGQTLGSWGAELKPKGWDLHRGSCPQRRCVAPSSPPSHRPGST